MGPIFIIVGMLLMIVIHEAGHFLAAKYFNMKATEAFFGFGPRVWSIQRGETEYGVKAFPLGGYVRIIGMNPFEEIPPEEEHRTYRFKPFWQKTIVVLAGIASHFVIGFFLFVILFTVWNERTLSTEVGNVSQVAFSASGAAEELPLLLEGGDSVISVDGVALDSLSPTTDKAPDAVIDVVVERDGEEITLQTNDNVVIAPSYLIGIQEGDRLVAIDGIAIDHWERFVELAHERPGMLTTVEVERDGELIANDVVLAERNIDGEVIGFLGVGPGIEETDVGVFAAMGKAAVEVGRTTLLSLEGLWTMVRQTPELLGAAIGQDAGAIEDARPVSVIGIARIASDLYSAVALLAYVNIFVGTLNFIPLYPLDGGHFAVALYEKIRGREADVRPLIPVAAAVFIFIMVLGLLGIYFDIVDPIPVPR
ncbi:MAG: RIP metalloprotease RseP [Acidimicrobiia bacterium]|nr:RIP metalloprotease RseP [Acidimicrobiia bacterium]